MAQGPLSYFKKNDLEMKFWMLSLFVMAALHAFQWTLPFQIDALQYLAHSGIYPRFPNFRGFLVWPSQVSKLWGKE